LEDNGWIPLLCLHHLAELANHQTIEIARTRLHFIGDLKLMAWVGTANAEQGLGTVVSLLTEEVRAALAFPSADIVEIRDRARPKILQVGAGVDAIGPEPDLWLEMRPVFAAQAEKARALAAFTRGKLIDLSAMKMGELLNGGIRRGPELARRLELIAGSYAIDIALRGDDAIEDPAGVADEFMRQAFNMAHPLPATARDLALRLLALQGLTAADIDPDRTLGETLDLGVFRTQLRIVAENLNCAPDALSSSVRMEQIPSRTITRALERHPPAVRRHYGSEITDGHLACLCAYADATLVDKRTLESFRRARPHEPDLSRLARRFMRAPTYRDIASLLAL